MRSHHKHAWFDKNFWFCPTISVPNAIFFFFSSLTNWIGAGPNLTQIKWPLYISASCAFCPWLSLQCIMAHAVNSMHYTLNLCFVMQVKVCNCHQTARIEACCDNVIHYFQAVFTLSAGWKTGIKNYTHANYTPFKQVSFQQKTKELSSNKSQARIVWLSSFKWQKQLFLPLRSLSIFPENEIVSETWSLFASNKRNWPWNSCESFSKGLRCI